jgi:exopolysaccharide biosynthesis polyprenyl glycosylphosphotransferase
MKIFLSSEYFIKGVVFIGEDSLSKDILNEMKNSDYRAIPIVNHADLNKLVDSGKVQVCVTAIGKTLPLSMIREMYKYKFKDIEVCDSVYFYEILTRKVAIKHYLEGDKVPYLSAEDFSKPVLANIKRFIDCLGAMLVLIICLPLFVLICLVIKLTSGSPIFYLQERLGLRENTFNLIKFRTMIQDAESNSGPQWASKDDSRVTKLGKFLRKTRLDELPQFINVLKGDMSFVGPRPIRRHFAEIIEEKVPFYSLRFNVKPGLTGWAQVHYDYGGTVEGHIEKFQYDLYYLKHASLFLELFIILKTLQTIIRRPAF